VYETLVGLGTRRFGARVDLDRVIELIRMAPQKYSKQGFDFSIDKLNKEWRDRALGFIEEAIANMRGTISYEHV
jgi:hypothetical protein